jgi:hypothetical protein
MIIKCGFDIFGIIRCSIYTTGDSNHFQLERLTAPSDEFINEPVISLSFCLAHSVDIADSLEFLAGDGVVHQDVSPNNVMFSRKDIVGN